MTASVDVILAAQTAVIAAKSLGIDSLITNGIFRKPLENAWKLLELPEKWCFPLISVVFGYPNQEPVHKKGRLDPENILHQESYQPYTADRIEACIRETDRPARHLGMIDNWKELGFSHYFEWFYSKWISPPDPGKPSHDFRPEFEERLRKSGFLGRL